MIVYVSRYAQVEQLLSNEIIPISISIGVPRTFKGPRLKKLAPTWAMLKMSEEAYCEKYAEILQGLKSSDILKELEELGNGNDVALLCYENVAKGQLCHRSYVAWWLNKELGIEVREFEGDTPCYVSLEDYFYN